MNQVLERPVAIQSNAVIRHVEREDREAMRRVGELHMELLSAWGPMAALGERFVREACYGVNMHNDLLQVELLEIDGDPAGFVAYTARSRSFHRSSLRSHWIRVTAELALALVSRPSRMFRLFRALGVVVSRRSEHEAGSGDALGEIVCIGVQPRYLTSKFVRATGIQASEMLIRHAAGYMRKSGVGEMRMLVDKPNKAALFLYHKLGARFTEFKQAGTPMVEVVFDLEETLPDSTGDVPPVWTDSEKAIADRESGWRRYWEQVSHNEKIFRHEAEDYLERFFTGVETGPHECILDFGCGYGFIAAGFAKRGHSVAVWDASSNARKHALRRLARYPGIRYLDLERGENYRQYNESFDLITVHSVIQYISDSEFDLWLKRWYAMLASGGRVLISDIVTPEVGTLPELASLLKLSWKKRFIVSALWECLRETPNYWKTRNMLSLNVRRREKLTSSAECAGYRISVLPDNLSHRRKRLTVLLIKPA